MKNFLLFLTMIVGLTSTSFAQAQLGTLVTKGFWPNKNEYSTSLESSDKFLGSTWTYTNFNNNNNDWENIRCGRKTAAATATIYSTNAIESAIGKFEVVIGASTSNVTSASLYVSSDSTFPADNTTKISYSNCTTAGTWSYAIPTEAQGENKYYKFEFVCAKASANGFLHVNSIIAYAPENPNAPKSVEITSQLQADNSLTVTLSCSTDGANIFYGYSEDAIINEYTTPFPVTEDCTIYAKAKLGEEESAITSLDIKMPYRSFKKAIDEAIQGTDIAIAGNFQVIYKSGIYTILTDGTSNILVYGAQDGVEEGTKVSVIEGHVYYYNDLFELTEATLTEGGNGASIEPTVIEAVSEIDFNYDDNLFDLVTVKSCDIKGKSGKNATLSRGGTDIAMYNNFNIDFENGTDYDVTGFVWRNKTTLQLSPTLVEEGEFIESVKTPVITPNKDELKSDDFITITCATPGAKIYYTLDGTDPSQESTLYESPIDFEDQDFTVKAQAFYEGDDKFMLPSEIAERKYHYFNPYKNVLTKDNHEGNLSSYTKHTCQIDDVDYAMYGKHDSTQGIQMNNSASRFCYIVQVGDNEGLAIESIEVDYHTNSNITFQVLGSNTPYDVFPTEEYNMDNEKQSITNNGVKIGVISKDNTKVEFTKDYNYFAFYPLATGVTYFDSITINYRDPQAKAEAPSLEDVDAADFESDEESLIIPAVPYHEDWIAKYSVNDGETYDIEPNDLTLHDEALDPATLHTIKIWYEHYYDGSKTEAKEFAHMTQPQFTVNAPQLNSENKLQTLIEFGKIGEGVKVYFTLNGTAPVVDETEAPANAIHRAAASGAQYTLDKNEDLDATHVITSATPNVVIKDIATGTANQKMTLTTQAVHESGVKSAVKASEGNAIDIPTGIEEIEAAAGEAIYFDLQGARIARPENGAYIRVLNGKAEKVVK